MSKESLLRSDDERSSCIDFKQLWLDSCSFARKALQMGMKDPRKAVYAFKMGMALSLVSLFIFWEQRDISQYAIWAILTVIVMFEFSIGATFIKGFNRGLGTFCAGMLAFLFAELSTLAGEWEKIVIVVSIFITGCLASYLRLYPTMAPYDYGYRVFVLTFCILMVAGNRTGEYNAAILTRLVLIAVGASICFLVNICICPIWAGDDLHRLVANNFKELATSLEGCVNGYTKRATYERIPSRFLSLAAISDDHLLLGYKTVIESANREQTLFGYAEWEPPHGRYRKRHYPWKNYVKLSAAVRHCAYTVMALHGCIMSEIQAPSEKRQVFRRELQRVSTEGARILRELGIKIEKMEKVKTISNILKEVHEAAEQLQRKIDQKSFLLVNSESWEIGRKTKVVLEDSRDFENMDLGFKSYSETAIYVQAPLRLPNKGMCEENLRKHIPWPSWISFEGDHDLIREEEVQTYESASALSLATFASLLIEFVARLQNVVDCFQELSGEAEFKDADDYKVGSIERAGLWTRFLRCFSIKRSDVILK